MTEIVFEFSAADEATIADVIKEFGIEEVSSSKRITGGFIVDVFIRPTIELIGKVLKFKTDQADRVKDAKVIIGSSQVILDAYSADDALRILNSEGFQTALAKLKGIDENAP